jgi:hypothetical protein
MKTYETFAHHLNRLLAGEQAVRITVAGYMPLAVEAIGQSANGGALIALSHTTVQNGDLMRDPEVVFQIHEVDGVRAAEPLSFRNDFTGTHQDVYRYDDHGHPTHVVPRLQKELRSFARMWFRNLREQGFFANDAQREVLA